MGWINNNMISRNIRVSGVLLVSVMASYCWWYQYVAAMDITASLVVHWNILGEVNPQQAFLHEFYRRVYQWKLQYGDPYIARMQDRVRALQDSEEWLDPIVARALSHAASFLDLQRGSTTWAVMLPKQEVSMSRENFLLLYGSYVTSSNPLPSRCFSGYDAIDAFAQQQDFPTSLIIASRYKEAWCHMINPRNGDGLFQIVAHEYGTWEITIDQLLEQAQHFIDFSHAKRERYKKLRRFDDLPVRITYEWRSLQDLRKHGVLYNGVTPTVTLESSRYANNGFGGYARPDISSQDGLVTLVLKVLAQAYAR